MSCHQSFTKTLRERGMRLTPQREMVLSAMHDLDDHATVDEIFRRVQAVSPAVDLSTVYRTLELLDGLQMLAKVESADGVRRYALAREHGDHVHLVCQSCGCEMTADLSIFAGLSVLLEAEHGYVLDTGHLALSGWCRGCAAAGARRKLNGGTDERLG